MYMFERVDTTGQRNAEHRARLLHGGSWRPGLRHPVPRTHPE